MLFSACGPEPTEASPVDLTGMWQSQAGFSVVSSVKMHVVQTSDGGLSGDWVAAAVPSPPGLCLGDLSPTATNTLSGMNGALQVSIEILGLGEYTAHITAGGDLKGIIIECGVVYPLSFSRVSS